MPHQAELNQAYYLEQWDTLKFSVIGHEYVIRFIHISWTSALALFFFFQDSAISYAIFRTSNSIMLFNSLLDCGATKSYISLSLVTLRQMIVFGYKYPGWNEKMWANWKVQSTVKINSGFNTLWIVI